MVDPRSKKARKERSDARNQVMSKPAIRNAIMAKAKKDGKSVTSNAVDNFIDTYKKTKVGPIQRAIADFFKSNNKSSGGSYVKPGSSADLNTRAQSNRARSLGGRTASQVKANQTERKQRGLASAAAKSRSGTALSNKAKNRVSKADAIAIQDTKLVIKKDVSKPKNYNVGVSKGGVPFKEAFAHFRKKGNKTFTWNGKKYTTELASKKGKK